MQELGSELEGAHCLVPGRTGSRTERAGARGINNGASGRVPIGSLGKSLEALAFQMKGLLPL